MLKSLRTGDIVRRMFLALALMAWGLVLGGVTCDQDRSKAVAELNKGLQAYQRGKTLKAVDHLKAAARADADYAKPRYQLGQIHEMSLDDPEEADRFYRAALDIESDNPTYAYALGRVLASEGKHGEAIATFKRSVKLEPGHAQAWFRLGNSQAAMGDRPEAVESYMSSIEADPRMTLGEDDPGGAAYHALGDLYVRFGFFDKALKVYENGITNNPEAPRLYQGRGVAQLEMKRYEKAASSFEKALELDDSYGTAYFNLAAAHEAMGHKKQAVAALKRYLRTADRSQNPARISVARGKIQTLEAEMKDEQENSGK